MSKSASAAPRGARYRGIIFSIIVFLLLILGILGLNLYSTFQINKNDIAINTSGQMRDLIQSMTRDLFNMKLSYGEDPNSPHVNATLKRLEANRKKFTEDLNAFDLGGVVADYSGKNIQVDPLRIASEREELGIVAKEWKSYGKLIGDYIPTATALEADSTALDLAILKAQESSVVIYEALDKLVNSIRARAEEQANLLRVVQIAGIAAVILYFIIFMFYFMRKLRAADRVANAARREIEEIMATVNEGLFLVDKDLNIGGQYSERLETLIGQKDIANRNLESLLGSMVSQKDMDTSKSFIGQLFNNKVKEKLVQDLNPLDRIEVQVQDEDGVASSRYLNFNFSRVYENKAIKRVLVGVADITPAVLLEQRLEREQEQNDQQMEMLTSILHANTPMLNSFIEHTKASTERINNILKRQSKSQGELREKASEIFREVHALKGEASALELESFVTLTHEFENNLQSLQNKSSLSGNDFLPMTVNLEQLIEQSDRVDALMQRLGNFSSVEGGASGFAQQATAESAADTLTPYFDNYVEKVAERNGKAVKLNTTGLGVLAGDEALSNKLNEVIVQLLRNAVVHGIEKPEVREAQGKAKTGELRIDFDKSIITQEVLLSVSDDGRGIDYPAVRKQLVVNGICSAEEAESLTKKQLIMLMFDGGFSTAEETTEDAGRGFGLDVIKSRVDDLRGKIQIQTKADEHTRFIIRIPLTENN